MKGPNPPRRKRRNRDTARVRAVSACGKHLKDLKETHDRPPADIPVPTNSTVQFIAPVPDGSYCTSPAQLCAELGEE